MTPEEPAIEFHEVSKRYAGQATKRAGGRWFRSRAEPELLDPVEDEDEDEIMELEDELDDEPPPRHEEDVWALRSMDLRIQPGARLGVLGGSGSGKSTLVKLLTRVALPTTGQIVIRGRVNPLPRSVAGLMWPYDSARANIVHVARFLGAPVALAKERTEAIAEFSGIGANLDQRVTRLSPGELQRLGISIALHLDPDILVADEVIAPGDEGFQNQCFEFARAQALEGVTTVLASADVETIRQLCDQAILLEAGEIVASGAVDDVADVYQTSAARLQGGSDGPIRPRGPIVSARLVDAAGAPVDGLSFDGAGAVEIRVQGSAKRPLSVRCALSLVGRQTTVRLTHPGVVALDRDAVYVFSAPLPPLLLSQDEYSVNVAAHDHARGFRDLTGKITNAFTFVVTGPPETVPPSGSLTTRKIQEDWPVSVE